MTITSSADLTGMRRVGQLVARTLETMRGAVAPGVTTATLDTIAERFARANGARSAPQLAYDFPGFTCISVDDEIVHGIPGPRVIRAGDVVKLDVTLELDGFIADAAITVLVPPVAEEARRLRRCARTALGAALDVARPGLGLRALGGTIDAVACREGFAVLRELTGHGVGRRIHEAPAVPNYAAADAHGVLRDGLVVAVEPMMSARAARVVEDADGWTLRTHNRALAVHHEHTIVVRHGRPVVLTML